MNGKTKRQKSTLKKHLILVNSVEDFISGVTLFKSTLAYDYLISINNENTRLKYITLFPLF